MVLAITKMYGLEFAIVHREHYTLSTQHLYILFVYDLDYIILHTHMHFVRKLLIFSNVPTRISLKNQYN